MSTFTLKFESDLPYQHDAVTSVLDLFVGLPLASNGFSVTAGNGPLLPLTELGVGNPSPAPGFEEALIDNLRSVQERNGLDQGSQAEGLDFTIEMETGTGKTYVYLRTIFELHRKHGFTKFVVVVPSVAIREGVISSIELMREHFRTLYSIPFDASVYDPKFLGRVRQFSAANTLQILVLNIDAFQKDNNIINRPNDQMNGLPPIEFVQACRPVVIVDEPQNMESAARSAALQSLNPFCTLRYSATHRTMHHPVYRLGPIEAHELHLVKSIEVASVLEDDNLNDAFVRLERADQASQSATVRINAGVGSNAKQRSVRVKQGDDLFVKSRERPEYATGFIVSNISFRPGDQWIEFSNGSRVDAGEAIGAFDDDVRRAQLRATIEAHFDRERRFQREGRQIKVLSLIFIDKVANYRQYTSDGAIPGPFAEWFEAEYRSIAAQRAYTDLGLPPAEDAHTGYFSQDATGKLKDTRGESNADIATYDLIMRDKARLLSFDEPRRFVFSHSALREGWDNPNVFQICTLNRTKSGDRKRQEIGRGLRLPVDATGTRVRDPHVNWLTVIANESYKRFAEALQTEYEEDTGRRFGVVERAAFARLTRPETHPVKPGQPFGLDGSAIVWDHLVDEGLIAKDGRVLPAFKPSDESFVLPVPPEYASVAENISAEISRQMDPLQLKDRGDRKPVKFRKRVLLDPGFQALWERVSKRTRYRVDLDSAALIAEAISALKAQPKIEAPKITLRIAAIDHRQAGLSAEEIRTRRTFETTQQLFLPDIMADLQNETDLTRSTLIQILEGSGRMPEFSVNPQSFLRMCSTSINKVVRSQVLTGLRYEEIAGHRWEMHRLEPEASEEVRRYASNLYEVQNAEKTPFDHVEFDSDIERKFARKLDKNTDVKFFIKLPGWFTVDTPIGRYNPDWAIMFERDAQLYLVRETKGSLDPAKLREGENTKIACAAKHFAAIGIDYDVVTQMDDLADQLGL